MTAPTFPEHSAPSTRIAQGLRDPPPHDAETATGRGSHTRPHCGPSRVHNDRAAGRPSPLPAPRHPPRSTGASAVRPSPHPVQDLAVTTPRASPPPGPRREGQERLAPGCVEWQVRGSLSEEAHCAILAARQPSGAAGGHSPAPSDPAPWRMPSSESIPAPTPRNTASGPVCPGTSNSARREGTGQGKAIAFVNSPRVDHLASELVIRQLFTANRVCGLCTHMHAYARMHAHMCIHARTHMHQGRLIPVSWAATDASQGCFDSNSDLRLFCRVSRRRECPRH